MTTINPTMNFAQYATKAYTRMNDEWWDGKLPPCLVTLQRHKGARGYFAADRFGGVKEGDTTHEIALNPETFDRSLRDITSTLLHEMVHLWQQEYGKPSRNGYHNKQWAEEMLRVGLTPVSVDNPGKMTGQKVSHDITEGGEYDTFWPKLEAELDVDALLRDIWGSNPARKKAANSKVKYTCDLCGANAWAKPDSNLVCGDCDERMEMQ